MLSHANLHKDVHACFVNLYFYIVGMAVCFIVLASSLSVLTFVSTGLSDHLKVLCVTCCDRKTSPTSL